MDPQKIDAYKCGSCASAWVLEKKAIECCAPAYCACGQELQKYRTKCSGCQDKEFARKESARFEKSEKVTITEYFRRYPDGMIEANGTYYQEEEFLDYLSEQEEPHAWYWAGIPEKMSLPDAHDLVSTACEDAYEDAYDSISKASIDALDVLLKAWSASVNVTSWCSDCSLAVVPSEQELVEIARHTYDDSAEIRVACTLWLEDIQNNLEEKLPKAVKAWEAGSAIA